MDSKQEVSVNESTWSARMMKRVSGAGNWSLFFFAVILPSVALGIELYFGICDEIFFDPLKGVFGVLAVASVPCGFFVAWLIARLKIKRPWLAGFAAGLAQGIAAYYAVIFLPLVVMGAMVLVMSFWYLGVGFIGVLPMAPLFAFIAGFRINRRVRQALPELVSERNRGLKTGWIVAALAVMVLASSPLITLVGRSMALSGDVERSAAGVRLLRAAGDKRELLRNAWHGERDLQGHLFNWDGQSLEEHRHLYYRVVGEDYSLTPSSLGTGLPWLRAARRESFDWDMHQGEEKVGGILKGLSLFGSRYEATADSAAGLGYAEWTLVFRNAHEWSEREARARIAVPPGAVVSRLTLWINGEEREAAFGGRSQVRQAYEQVVQRRRDPVIVATCGPDTIQMQCYPVPPKDGEMQLRIGFTVPLEVATDGATAILPAPMIVHRNFRMDSEELELPRAKQVTLEPPLAGACWVADNRGETPATILQTAELADNWRPARLAVVVDGSAGLRPHAGEIAKALLDLPDNLEVSLWVIEDLPRDAPTFTFTTPLTAESKARLAKLFEPSAFIGGRSSLRTLLKAWDDLGKESDTGLLWIHAPEAYLATSAVGLTQRLERAPAGKRFMSYQITQGSCKACEALDGVRSASSMLPPTHPSDISESLRKLFESWRDGGKGWHFKRTRAAEPPQERGVEASEHVARAWAADEVRKLLISGDAVKREAASRIALHWNIVTPVSSAVVLETKQQYDSAGLTPVSAETVPTVPEPAFWVSLLVALAVLLGWRWRERRAARAAV